MAKKGSFSGSGLKMTTKKSGGAKGTRGSKGTSGSSGSSRSSGVKSPRKSRAGKSKAPVSESYARKESIVKRLNERIASIVRNAGIDNEEYNRWALKLTRQNSPYASTINTYDPSRSKTAKNLGANQQITQFIQLSRKKADIEAMSIEDLERLEGQTRGWGAIRQEAMKALKEQRKKMKDEPMNNDNPFESVVIRNDIVRNDDIINYLKQKEQVRQFIEGNTDAFYALIEATGWDDIRDHTTEEIYNEVQKLDMSVYAFSGTLSEIGEAYIQRRTASREHRASLGI